MKVTQKMQQHVDSTGWATFGTAIGMYAVAPFVVQFGKAMFTLITGVVIAHFIKRFLNHYWPLKKGASVEEVD